MKRLSVFLFIIVLLISVEISNATPTQWLDSEGGNGNWYEVINVTLNWSDAKLAAENLGGHLVTITSAEENAWLTQQFGYGLDKIFWIGAYQLTGSPEPAGGWTWVTDEVFNFTNWCYGVSRQAILNGFIYSIEFENLCNAYGIAPYSA